ncbi:hypothetical protein C9374_001193 [Naegleria lovaniensis]|uniref:Uncharacterized protein n=1 Tax=Naegleria lovaniensis TaxID=51637 RepID=A0AA88GWU9_NAELO|nr:uncharacterized protein C9374_001193 [Naegleria lovaniensis]KAG2387599.1 hypothetical protein C9374_001193 [Naegleria lovaniensis]
MKQVQATSEREREIAIKDRYPFYYNTTWSNFHVITRNMTSNADEELFIATDIEDIYTNRIYVFVKLYQLYLNSSKDSYSKLYLLRVYDQQIAGNDSNDYNFELTDQEIFVLPDYLKCTAMSVDRYSKVLLLTFVHLSNAISTTSPDIPSFCQRLFIITTWYGNLTIINKEGILLEDTCLGSGLDPTVGNRVTNNIEIDSASRLVYILSAAYSYVNYEPRLLKLKLVDTDADVPTLSYQGYLLLDSIRNYIILNIYSEISNIGNVVNRFLYIGVHYLRKSEDVITTEVKQIDLVSFKESKSINILPNEQSVHSNIKVSKSDATEIFVVVKYYLKEFCLIQKVDMMQGQIYYQSSGLRCEDFRNGDILLDTSPFDLFFVTNTHIDNYLSSFSMVGGPFSSKAPPEYKDFSINDPRLNFPYRDEIILSNGLKLRWRFLSLDSYTTYEHADQYGFIREYYPVIAIVSMESDMPFQEYLFLLSSIEIDVSPPYTSSEGFYIFVYENWFSTCLVSFIVLVILIILTSLLLRCGIKRVKKWRKRGFERIDD